jgi:hypothetical protein
VPLQTNCAAFKAVESLVADFVECLNRTAEIGTVVDAVSKDFLDRKNFGAVVHALPVPGRVEDDLRLS